MANIGVLNKGGDGKTSTHWRERLRSKSVTHRFLACAVDGCLLMISEVMNPGFQAEWEDFNFSFEHVEFDMRVLETFKAVGKKGKLKETTSQAHFRVEKEGVFK